MWMTISIKPNMCLFVISYGFVILKVLVCFTCLASPATGDEARSETKRSRCSAAGMASYAAVRIRNRMSLLTCRRMSLEPHCGWLYIYIYIIINIYIDIYIYIYILYNIHITLSVHCKQRMERQRQNCLSCSRGTLIINRSLVMGRDKYSYSNVAAPAGLRKATTAAKAQKRQTEAAGNRYWNKNNRL